MSDIHQGLVIRAWQAQDSVSALTRLLNEAYATLLAQGWNFTAATQGDDMTRERMQDGHTLVAWQDGVLVGTVSIRPPKQPGERYISDEVPPLYATPGHALLSQLAVSPACRGAGLGDRLMDAAEAWAAGQGYQAVVLDTAEPAEALRRRYLRRGYAEMGPVQWQGKTYRSVLMKKTLAASPQT